MTASVRSGLAMVSTFLFCAVAQADVGLDGVYEGTLNLVDGKERQIPLQLDLSISDETEVVSTPTGPQEQRVIDGAILVDDEGGPYAFTKILFDIDSGRIDMRYSSRLGAADDGSRKPSALRLSGTLDDKGLISGRVVSGVVGVVGTFKAQKIERKAVLVREKFVGKWTGDMKIFDLSVERPVTVFIQPASSISNNPANFEFSYTRGKVGSLNYGFASFPFSTVNIDYLRRKMTLTNAENGINSVVLECEALDENIKTLDCEMQSVLKGRAGRVLLKSAE